MLATADVYRLSLHPPFCLGGFCNKTQSLVAVCSVVINGQVLRCHDSSHLPIRRVAHTGIDTANYKAYMFCSRSGKREYGLVLAIRVLQYQQPFDEAFNSIELHVVAPFALTFFGGQVTFLQPVAFALEFAVIVHVELHETIMHEGKGQQVVATEGLVLLTVVAWFYPAFQIVVAAVYFYHFRTV